MELTRRAILAGSAAFAAALADPETAWAAAVNRADWSLGVADLDGDIAPHPMRLVRGRAPAALSGVLYRNGPARFRRPGGNSTHWFDGDGLVRRIAIDDGRATFAARFGDTHKRRLETQLGAMVVPGFGTPGTSAAKLSGNDEANAANTSVFAQGGKLWALWEGGSPLEMDPATLATRGFVTLRDDLKAMPFSAHPRYEPDGTVWNFGLAGIQAILWKLSPRGELQQAEVIKLPRASYFHDFTATERCLIIVLQPWIRERMAMPYVDGLTWRPEQGTQVLVIDKADLSRRRVWELPAFSYFHLGDAWEEGDGTIRFDLCSTTDPMFGVDGARKILLGSAAGASPPHATLARIALHPDGRGVYESSDTVAEFPRSDPRFAGEARRLTFHATGIGDGDAHLPRGLAATDLHTGRSDVWDAGPRQLVEEGIFVPRPGSTAEGDGWLVATSINLDAQATELHVLDARRVSAGPLATFRADAVAPFTFHGVFVQGARR